MKVSVYMITYNHEQYIATAIESILAQKVNFDFELVIGEDISSDTTLHICKQYADQYPEIIKLLPSDKKYGAMGNGIRTLSACKGDYIALCEGDDYWIDPLKLQKQVDFLELNPDFSICFSAVDILDEIGVNWPYEKYFPKLEKDVLTIEDFILSWMSIIPTPTMVLRNVLPDPLPYFVTNAMSGDIAIQLLAADKGKAKYLPEKMAVYRNHSGSITKTKRIIEHNNERLMKLFSEFNKYFEYKYNAIFRKRFLVNAKYKLIAGASEEKGLAKIKHYFKRMPDYIKYSDKIDYKEMVYYHFILFFPFILKWHKKITKKI